MKKVSSGLCFLTIALCMALATSCESTEGEPIALGGSGGFQGIVGGEETGYEDWQGAVGLMGGVSLCTGTLIAPNVVLSAGHCVYSPSNGFNYVKNPELLQILGGATVGEVFYSYAEEVVKHPSYNGMWGTDLSMIKLETPIDVGTLPPHKVRKTKAKKGDKGVIAGYGSSTDYSDQTTAGTHRWGETTILSMGSNIQVGDPTGLCSGDSGGPFFTEEDGDWVVTGVASWVAAGCSATSGSMTVNVVTYRGWINKVYEQFTGEPLEEPEEEDTETGTETDTEVDPDGGADTAGDADADADSDSDAGPTGEEDDDDNGSSSSCDMTSVGRSPARGMLASAFLRILL